MNRSLLLGLLSVFAVGSAQAASLQVPVNLVSADGAP